MDKLTYILVLAFLGEAIWETLKMTWQEGKVSIDRIGALVISVLLAYTANIDIFALMGIGLSIPLVGVILTGVLISRGTNFVHDLITKLTKNKINPVGVTEFRE
ncbi:MAG: hypothetical protein DBY38_10610 [Clostridium cadaveris]|uniref:Uncharacterized protein n=1 Tax=Clostridium cadaveris TaxID=1529 RepID=A0A316M4M1_9CLOT|nr:hypothetical protein [Clostridium cadaveris]MDU4953650.1 hypothetical protein [Clostridium sp.]NWK11306.1 hypothetical protein [Clostridium cadaveris]PWL52578.1 MAG: hypothetical protein DBY38_10610 [Clostridium cadaveris]